MDVRGRAAASSLGARLMQSRINTFSFLAVATSPVGSACFMQPSPERRRRTYPEAVLAGARGSGDTEGERERRGARENRRLTLVLPGRSATTGEVGIDDGDNDRRRGRWARQRRFRASRLAWLDGEDEEDEAVTMAWTAWLAGAPNRAAPFSGEAVSIAVRELLR